MISLLLAGCHQPQQYRLAYMRHWWEMKLLDGIQQYYITIAISACVYFAGNEIHRKSRELFQWTRKMIVQYFIFFRWAFLIGAEKGIVLELNKWLCFYIRREVWFGFRMLMTKRMKWVYNIFAKCLALCSQRTHKIIMNSLSNSLCIDILYSATVCTLS